MITIFALSHSASFWFRATQPPSATLTVSAAGIGAAMQTETVAALPTTTTLEGTTTTTLAGHVESKSAKKASFSLVNAFQPCNSPNSATASGNVDACAPALAATATCALGESGSGSVKLVVSGQPGEQDVKVSVKAKGLNESCEGQELSVHLVARVTTGDCPEGSCTYERELVPPATCVVSSGACSIKTLLSTSSAVPAPGHDAGIELLGCSLQDANGAGDRVAACGLLLK
jgi:hypothetical protein